MSTRPEYLVRVWGRDEDFVKVFRKPDTIETEGALCYWFDTIKSRKQFLTALRSQSLMVVSSEVNPGYDSEHELIDTRRRTIATVRLRLPDGREGTFEQDFGYGYPSHAVRYMWESGNYSCDCNKRLFLARHCRIDLENDSIEDLPECGDDIELVSLDIRKVN